MSTQAAPQTSTWTVDKAHSSVEFSVKHMMFTTVKGQFTDFDATVVEDAADPARSSVEATINVGSIDTRDEKRDAHLRSADFFLADEHPTMTFKSTQVVPRGEDKFAVTGDLTIRGVTRQVTLDATKNGAGTNPWGMQVAGYSAATQINRKDFGLQWNVALETGGMLVGDTVKISLELELIKQS